MPHVLPLVFDYGTDLLQIGPDFMMGSLIWSSNRSAAPSLGLEVVGVHHSLHCSSSSSFLNGLWEYRNQVIPNKRLVVLLDTEREDHVSIQLFPQACVAEDPTLAAVFTVFEDRDACAQFVRRSGSQSRSLSQSASRGEPLFHFRRPTPKRFTRTER